VIPADAVCEGGRRLAGVRLRHQEARRMLAGEAEWCLPPLRHLPEQYTQR
jgi:hypothetical protein